MHDFETRVAAAKRAIREHSVDGVQRRSFALDSIDIRDATDTGYTIAGHGAVFNSMSENLGGFREIIAPGAFAEVLAGAPDVRALYNHDPNLTLARTTNGTLRLHEDPTGLAYSADVADTSYGRDLRVLLARGDITQSSFAFRVARGGDTWDEDDETGALIRTITKFSALFDVSPVTYPAYPAADSGLASKRMDTEGIGTIGQMLALAADFLDDEDDPDDITAMESVITTLTGLLSAEETEAASFARIAERIGGGPSAGERANDGGDTDSQADDAPWRLKAAQRRMALRQAA